MKEDTLPRSTSHVPCSTSHKAGRRPGLAADGYRKISFLWRLFRYERKPDGKTLDLLFLPVMRTGEGS